MNPRLKSTLLAFERETLLEASGKAWRWFPVPLLILLYLSYLNRGFQVDDALIYQRYIQNFLDGHGLVYNPGEKFNGLTSPLYTYLSILAGRLAGDLQTGIMALATSLMVMNLAVYHALFRKDVPPAFLALGGVAVASFPYFYSTYGMETPLFVGLIGWCLLLFRQQNIFWLGIACALLVLTRSEGIFLVLAMAIEHFRLRRPFPALRYFIIPALLFCTPLAINLAYYGAMLPETGMAKIQQGESGYWGQWPIYLRHVGYQLDWYFQSSHGLFMLFLGAAMLGVLSLGRLSLNIVILFFLLFYTGFYVVLNIPNYHWYYAPLYGFGLYYAAFGTGWLYRRLRTLRVMPLRLALLTGVAAIALVLSYGSFRNTLAQPAGLGKPFQIYKDIGLWLRDNTAEDARVALAEIGHVGYYSGRYMIDILGLVNPHNAGFVGEKKMDAWLRHYTPDYILVHKPAWPLEIGASWAALLGDFVPAPGFRHDLFSLFRRNSGGKPAYFPDSVEAPDVRPIVEENRIATMVHAPGSIAFQLTPGVYSVSAEFGLAAETYAPETQFITDGVRFLAEFETTGQRKTRRIFDVYLDPAQNEADRGIHTIKRSFRVDADTRIILRNLPGPRNNGQSDWSFWRNVQIERLGDG